MQSCAQTMGSGHIGPGLLERMIRDASIAGLAGVALSGVIAPIANRACRVQHAMGLRRGRRPGWRDARVHSEPEPAGHPLGPPGYGPPTTSLEVTRWLLVSGARYILARLAMAAVRQHKLPQERSLAGDVLMFAT
jgi:hypothetical protein